jgi:ribosomal protein S18 acetylase RimI-like enzyme
MQNYTIRVGTIEDLPFLEKMLYEAIFWSPSAKRLPVDEIFAVHEISKILHQWQQRNGDFSLIALNDQNNPIGSVWYRLWTIDNHSFGYIDDNTPEIGIAVLKEYRGEGVGAKLMKAIIEHASDAGIKKLSLSVDPNNFAFNLYQKFGFIKVSEYDTSWNLVKTL